MELSSRIVNNVLIIDVIGEIDIYNSSNIKELIMKKVDDGENKIIINLARVNYIDSSGIGTFISCNSLLAKYKGALIIENVNDSIQKIFRLTQLDSILYIAKNGEEALNFFKNRFNK